MTYQPAHTPGPNERFTVRQLAHDEVPYWFHPYSKKPPYASNSALGFNQGWGFHEVRPDRQPRWQQAPHLLRGHLTRTQLIDSLPVDYPHTRPWAAAALAQRPDAQAIGYTSRRNDAARCLMLVEQRLPGPPFDVIEDDCIGTSAVLRREVLDLVDSLGVSVL